MGTLLSPRQGIGGMDSDPVGDGDIAPLLRWALHEQVSGQAPGDAVWQGVQGKVSARQSHRAELAQHLMTATSAVVVAVLVLTAGMMYSVDDGQLQLATDAVQPTGVVETEATEPALPIVAALPIVRALSLPHPDVDAPDATMPASSLTIEKPRVVQPVDTQDDALRPIRKLRVILVAPVPVQPGSIVSVVIRGEPPKPI